MTGSFENKIVSNSEADPYLANNSSDYLASITISSEAENSFFI